MPCMQSKRRKCMTTLAGVGATLAVAGCSGADEGTPTAGDSMGNKSMTECESMTDSMS